ncbi:hypothetical protein KC929_00945 [Patescibacteria group bacterium]|nr:hypothetical protein [Patescibacteria group bacterium]
MSSQVKLNELFTKTKERYPQLKEMRIKLKFKHGFFFTMRSGIEFPSLWKKERVYFVAVNTNKFDGILSQLSEDDLVGWFAHELGHIVEYNEMSNRKFIFFVIQYLFDIRFRFLVERRVNALTVNSGFAKELIGAWEKFLTLEGVHPRYKQYIIKNYAPCWEDIEEEAIKNGFTKEGYKKLTMVK